MLLRPFALALAASLASAAQAGPITYGQALDAANRQAPALRAASLQLEAATTAATAAWRLPDPKLGVGLDNAPISGPNAGRLGADEMTMARIGFSQDVPSAAKRRAQRGRAQADIAAASAEAGLTAQQVRLETAGAWIELFYAQKKLAALDEILSRLEPVWQAAPSAVASGRARSAQALEAQQMRAVFLDRRSGVEADLARAQAQVRRFNAVRDGALLRVRPKAMTVAVILAGLTPILLGHGAGAEVMSRIAAPMVGGMLTAPLLSMFVVPAGYLLLRRRTILQGGKP